MQIEEGRHPRNCCVGYIENVNTNCGKNYKFIQRYFYVYL